MLNLADGEYDTCPKFGPQIYMPDRRVVVRNNTVTLIVQKEYPDTPDWLKGRCWSFHVSDFFKVNNLFNQ